MNGYLAAFLATTALLCGCTSTPSNAPAFRAGDIAIARNFTRYPQYNGTPVTITGKFKWRWVKEAHALRCYEITTVDGHRLAAQSFQLHEVRRTANSD